MDYIPPECFEPPPAIYDHEPEVLPAVEFVSAIELRLMADLLGDTPKDWIICGATVRGGGEVVVFILKDLPEWAVAFVKRHEFGHVNGWEH